MQWIHGYLAFFSLWAVIVLRDFLPLIPYLYVPIPSLQTWCVLFGYLASVILLGVLLPGKVYRGATLSDGKTSLKYKCNGLLILIVLTCILALLHFNGMVDGTWVANHYDELFIASNIFAFTLSTVLFVKGRYFRGKINWMEHKAMLHDSSSSSSGPSVWHDYVMGSELNPHLFNLDVKFFSYRPSMMGWLLINLSFLAKHYAQHDGSVTTRMLMYQCFTGWYVVDYFVNEPKMLHTWDILAEHFGLMLVWGDYVFIVFAFSIQNFYLLATGNNTMGSSNEPSVMLVITNVLLFMLGFAIFRGTNSQKHRFKENPQTVIWGKKAEAIDGRLLYSGFWGIARHFNYTGDCILAFSFCMPCGFKSSLPYFYFIYLLLLTLHREKRDEERCSAKYKKLWQQYCQKVPYRMLPYVY